MRSQRGVTDRIGRRRDAATAGHRGDTEKARAALEDPDGGVRATGLSALARVGTLTDDELTRACQDHDPCVRRRGAEVLASRRRPTDQTEPSLLTALLALLADPDTTVVETAAWAAGEFLSPPEDELLTNRRPEDLPDSILEALESIAIDNEDALCREAAVAALGALGDERGLPTILAALNDKATVRRRAVIALAPFEGAAVEAALEHARDDRDWQVRQAAEDLLSED